MRCGMLSDVELGKSLNLPPLAPLVKPLLKYGGSGLSNEISYSESPFYRGFFHAKVMGYWLPVGKL